MTGFVPESPIFPSLFFRLLVMQGIEICLAPYKDNSAGGQSAFNIKKGKKKVRQFYWSILGRKERFLLVNWLYSPE